MAFVHGKSGEVLLDDYRHTRFLKGYEITRSRDLPESSTLGDEAKAFAVPGQRDGKVSFDGLLDYDSSGANGQTNEKEFSELVSASAASPCTVAPAGTGTVGNVAYVAKVREASYKTAGPIGGLVPATADLQSDHLDRGRVLHGHTAESSTANGTAVDNAASSSGGAAASLHVTANTRAGSSTIKVQHSSDNVTFVDLITFAAVAASTQTSEHAEVTGTVNRYLRATWTPGGASGSITFVVAFARRS